MAQQSSQGLVARQGLSDDDLAQIRRLAGICNRNEGLDLKLNWDDLRSRPAGETNDFMYYHDGALVGFLGLYIFGSRHAEVSGMVHPDRRRRGIFRALLAAAQAESRRRNIPLMLLICDRASGSGRAFAGAIGAAYAFSEHKMELDEQAGRPAGGGAVRLRLAQVADAGSVAQIIVAAFGGDEDETRRGLARDIETGARQVYIGELEGQPIGALNLSGDGEDIGIYGFGVLPAHHGRGYGRQMLAQAIQEALARRPRKVTIEVETRNSNALGLYLSCGFREVATYDYYRIDLAPQQD